MKTTLSFVRFCRNLLRRRTPLKTAMVVVALAAIAYGGQVTIFEDDFQRYGPGIDPGEPPIGEPWQISETAEDSVAVAVDRNDDQNHVLEFGRHRNLAVVPFSAFDRQRMETFGNVSIGFDYFGMSKDGFSNYFDVAGYDPVSGDPAFFFRFDAPEIADSGGLHDVYYLDPIDGLTPAGISVRADATQAVSIALDFTAETYVLDVEGDAATLPMFVCPSDIADVQFSNYGVEMGSGAIDNVSVGVTQPDGALQAEVPEVGAVWLLAVGALVGAFTWLMALWNAKPAE